MIEIAGLLLGIFGIAFAFETPRRRFVSLFQREATRSKLKVAQDAPISVAQLPASSPATFGATQSGRHPFFIDEPKSSLSAAMREARLAQKPIFLVIYDAQHPTKSQLYYSLGCFLDYFTTKRIVQDHFVSALVPATDEEAAALVPADDPLENCLWVVLRPDGTVLRKEGVYANPDEGLKRVRSVVAALAEA